jgi:hypothetical protein
VLDLVLVFVGFGLVPDLRAFHPFHPIANSTLFIWSPPRGGLLDQKAQTEVSEESSQQRTVASKHCPVKEIIQNF